MGIGWWGEHMSCGRIDGIYQEKRVDQETIVWVRRESGESGGRDGEGR